MRKIKKLLAALMAITLIFQFSVFADNKVIVPNEDAKFFEMVTRDLVEIYNFELDQEELLRRTIRTMLNEDPSMLDSFLKAMFDSLDDYSEFYSPEEYKEATKMFNGIIGGIGITVNKTGNYVVIVSVIDGGSAKNAGILPGDLIVAVNGEDMFSRPMDYVTSKIKGDVGTSVSVTVERGGVRHDYYLTRCELKPETAQGTMLTDKTAYIAITQFTDTTDVEFKKVLDSVKSKGAKQLIIDLRYNTGGYVQTAVNVAKLLVPRGTIITHKMKYNDYTTVYRSELNKCEFEIVTLVNEYTASASEILASALQESGASVLVGEQTFGKAVTQNVMGLYEGRGCKITTGEYITRNGNSINMVGITPDYEVYNEVMTVSETTMKKFKYLGTGYWPGGRDEGVYILNERLSLLGYDVDLTDVYNEKTDIAIKSFQELMNLKTTGFCDITTQMYIANETNSMEVTVDMQLAKALELLGSEDEVPMAKE